MGTIGVRLATALLAAACVAGAVVLARQTVLSGHAALYYGSGG